MATDPVHPEPTRKSGYRYQFTEKHHGGGTSEDARWAEDLSHADEFSVFDAADFHDVTDEGGRLYGVFRTQDGVLRDLGTWQQQIAGFPRQSEGSAWHGYPIWAVNHETPANRSGQQMRPAKAVFQRMQDAGLITKREKKRLLAGKHT